MTRNDHQPAGSTLRSPWVLVENGVVDHSADVLQRLTNWLLTGTDTTATTRCTRALSLGETDDPISIASWTDALATRLRHRAEQAQP